MNLRLQAMASLLSATMLAGCAGIVPSFDVPKDPESGSPNVVSIVNRVTCELANLVAPGAPNATELLTGQYEVAVQLDLTVNDTGGLAPSVTYASGPFAFGLGAKLEQSREQYFSQKLYYSLLDLRNELNERENAVRAGTAKKRLTDCSDDIDTNLAGDLGIRQAVDMALASNYLKTDAKAADQGAFGGSVNFLVTKNLNGVGPTWTLTHFTGPGGLSSVSEVNTDKLTFAFAVADPPLNAAQLAARYGAKNGRPARAALQRLPNNFEADRLLQQLQINQISNRLSSIRALQ
ncbi:hypothetical protein V1282_005637 [Nitrobacteraceae bacterium AZCC 2146]